jgi:hypothetical protein
MTYPITSHKPKRRRSYRFLAQIPWSKLIQGDCVEVPLVDLEDNHRYCRDLCYPTALQHGYRVHTELDDHHLRIWRI